MNAMTYLILKDIKQTPNNPANAILDKNNHSEWYKETLGDEE